MIKDLFKRSSLYFIGLLIGRASTILILIFLARRLQPQSFGNLILFTTLIQLFTFLSDFGLNQWYQKRADVEDKRILFNKVFYSRLMTLLFTVVVSMIFLYLTDTFSRTISILFVLSLIPEAFLSIIDGYYLEKKQPIKVALKIIIRNAFFVYFIFVSKFNLDLILFVYLVGGFFSLFILFPWKVMFYKTTLSFKDCINTLKKSSPYALLIITSYFYARGDHLVIKYSLSSTALGIYGVAYRYLEALSLIPTALTHNLFPLAAQKESIKISSLVRISLVMFLIGIITMVVLYLGSDFLIVNLIGSSYIQAVPLLKIFSLVVLLFFINAPFSTVVQSSNLVKKFLPYGIFNTLGNLILNIVFVPLYGFIAAAWVMLFTEITGFFINIYFVKKLYSPK